MLSKFRRFSVTAPDGCKHCGLCQQTCPSGSAVQAPGYSKADCFVCGRCSEICPVDNFGVNLPAKETGETSSENRRLFSRREILRSGGALAIACAALPSLTRRVEANPLRPPGALDEEAFLARCSRCGRCIRACPSSCLKEMPLSSGTASFLTPTIIPREARCELTMDCQKVCPTGAISALPVEQCIIGLAVIERSHCVAWAEGKLCLICQENCPQAAIDIDDLNRPSVLNGSCVGCGACENACPVDEPAIVIKAQDKRKRT